MKNGGGVTDNIPSLPALELQLEHYSAALQQQVKHLQGSDNEVQDLQKIYTSLLSAAAAINSYFFKISAH